MKKHGELLVGGCILAAGIVLFIAAQFIDTGAEMARGGAFMPKVATTLLLVLAAAQCLTTWLDQKRSESNHSGAVAKDVGAESEVDSRALYLNIALLTLYVLLLKPIGFLIMTAVYVALQMYLYAPKEKRYAYLCPVVGVLSSVVIYYTFVFGFELLLPSGILG